MSNYYKIVDLPKIPKNLIVSLDEMLLLGKKFPSVKTKNYLNVNINPELQEWINDIFNKDCYARYQIIEDYLRYHVDGPNYGGESFKYNYIIDTGGDNVVTKWERDGEILAELRTEQNQWYYMNVGIRHGVWGATRPRLSVVVRPDIILKR